MKQNVLYIRNETAARAKSVVKITKEAHTARDFNMSSTPRAMAQKCLRRFVSLAWKDCLKELDAPYRSGPSKNWIKVKNPKSPAAIGLSMGPITPSPNLGTVLRLELPRERGSYGFDPGVIGGAGSNGSSGVIIAKRSV
jgi:hypothetical protein